MSSYIEKAEQITLPVVTLRGTVAFPSVPLNIELSDDASDAAVRTASGGSPFVFLVAAAEQIPSGQNAEAGQLYRVGTVAKIKQLLRSPEGTTRVMFEGFARAVVSEYRKTGNYTEADLVCKTISLPDHGGIRGEACIHELLDALEENLQFLPTGSEDILNAARLHTNPGALADFIAANVLVRMQDKQTVLECFDPFARTEALLLILGQESELMEEEASIRRRVSERMNRNQREFYLREQIKVIEEELGEGGSDVDEYKERISSAHLPKEVEEKLLKETDRLDKTPYGSAESTVIINYLDTCLDIPWNNATHDRTKASLVQKVLDEDHNGLEKVKERIVEYIAAKQMSPELRNQILCLVGPPGVGKTSIASSIARAMNRKYVRISLGGIRDEADIRGHRKTYIGAMPGRIITAVTQAKVRNPLILLDEIDKLTRDAHGDPTSALLEVLDSEQNKVFRDHFVELPFDLSDCVFIATANSLDAIPRPLRDRMEIIELGIYSRREKLAIAKEHLIPKQLKRHGLTRRQLKFSDDAIYEIIDYYTHEAGVRSLERAIAAICRKVDRRLIEKEKTRVSMTAKEINSYLGVRKTLPDSVGTDDEIGVVNGLAYTELGGTLLKVEVAVLDGTGKIETTGSLGDVMKESAHIAVSYVRSIAASYGIPTDFYKTKDIHIHFPEGAVPKDGPSAGVTMVTALVSALSGRAVRHDVAMTGEISLRGKVLPIGGLKEKTMAAYTAGAKTVLIPQENVRDLEEIDALARENLHFIPCRTADEILSNALVPDEAISRYSELAEKTPPAPVFLPSHPSTTQIRI
ncbi:MAG: endopeptidase La [Clostridia bacterium]|nr:endopeptidase La [Clostridia bacterium]